MECSPPCWESVSIVPFHLCHSNIKSLSFVYCVCGSAFNIIKYLTFVYYSKHSV